VILSNFDKSPKEAVEYIKNKGLKLSFDYQEIMHEAHHKAFTVAKITKLDLLADVKEHINSAIKDGKTYAEFKKDILPTLIKKGWWGDDVEVEDPKSGEKKIIKVNDRRLKNILYTNARVSYQVGKAKKIYENKSIKYIKYISILDNTTRPSHKSLHGKILAKDDPFWNTNFPPNGWNCRCRVQGLTQRMADKRKKDIVSYADVDNIADDDWAYDVKDGRFFDRFSGNDVEIKADSNYQDFGLPSIKEINRDIFPQAPQRYKDIKDKSDGLDILKKEILQGEKEVIVKTPITKDKKSILIKTPITDVLIDEKGLKHLMVKFKNHREQYAKFIIPTLQNPDEVYRTKYEDRQKRYHFFKYFNFDGKSTFSVCRINRDGSIFVTFFIPDRLNYIDDRRVGELIHKAG
jgi:SPP1 gp7 family putative phage head morphogenesis protein